MKNQIKYVLTLISLFFVVSITAQIRNIRQPLVDAKSSAVNTKYLPLYQWYSPSRGDNFLTTDPKWAGKKGAKKSPDYRFVRIEGYIFSPLNKQPANTMPIYSWYSPTRGDNFITSDLRYKPNKKLINGYKFVRKEGYIAKSTFVNGIALQSHWSVNRKDNFATAHPIYKAVIGKKSAPDYKLYRTEGFVIDPSKIGKFNSTKLVLATKPVVFKKAYTLDSKHFVTLKPAATTADASSSARQGVNIDTYEDISDLLGDVKFESFLEKLNISREIFPDKNTASNYYYYLPSTYTLKWDRESGKYAFKIFYLSSENGENGSVLIKVDLVSNINKKDLALAEKFLRSKLGNNKIELIPMPVQGVSIDFGSALTNFSVKPESVSINATSDYLQPIVVEWKMESKVDDFVSAMLSDFGLDAKVNFLLEDGESVSSVPLNLQISDPITFGKLEVLNTNEIQTGWTNYLDYPIVLKQLVTHKKNAIYLNIFNLDNAEVSPGETFPYTHNDLNDAIDRMWLDYSILECKECKEVVRKKIIGGTSGSQITNLEIQILNLIETSEAYMFKLNIKSKQADPNGMTVVLQPAITIKEDDQNFSGGKYYVPENATLSYEYQLIQIMSDGQTFTSPWHKGDQSFLVIGASQLENIFKESGEEGWKGGENLDSLKDSLVDTGKELIENLFKKKNNEEEDKPDD